MKSGGPWRAVTLISLLAIGLGRAAVAGADTGPTVAPAALSRSFRHPPNSAKPQTWWHWMNGMVTEEGITRDLEAMKAVGLGAAQMFYVTDGIPPGPVPYMSAEWRRLTKHAVQTADRLGLKLCIHNCAGWSSSGGPWNTPEHAMQVLTWTETTIAGPRKAWRKKLPQPPSKLGFYRDIAVLAFPTPPADRSRMKDAGVKLTSAAPGFRGQRLLDGDRRTYVAFPKPKTGQPQAILVGFADPFTACSLTLVPGPGYNGLQGQLQVSDDGKAYRTVREFTIPSSRRPPPALELSFPPVRSRHFRLLFTRGDARSARMTIAELELHAAFRLDNWRGKAGFIRSDRPGADGRTAPSEAVVRRGQIRDLTGDLTADGVLTWDVPAGTWTVLRIGHTPTGKENHPAPDEGRGPECDKLSKEAAEAHWDGMMAKVISDVGPLAGRTLDNVLIDSYEVHAQNWTPDFPEQFRKRCGYDLLPFLPTMAGGRVVDSTGVSERVLWDVRRTIADLFAENYFGHFAEMAHRNGMLLSTEPYGDGNFDNLQCGGKADIPMAEFWVGHGSSIGNSKQASSIAHTYGRTYVGAEAFTAGPDQGGWRTHPFALKRLGDLMFCAGINRFIFHEYAQQPWIGVLPGMTMGPHGFHFNRCITWWKEAPAWTGYLARCQFLLQQGLFVADLCYYQGEDAPAGLPGPGGLVPKPPPGFDYDGCDTTVLLSRMSVRDGRIVLPDGMTYRVLVLPERRTMTPRVLRKVRELVRAGAVVVGPRPVRSPSFRQYPECDREVQTVAGEIWGDCDGKKITEHRFGKGRVYWGAPLEKIFAALKIEPDFEFRADRGEARLAWIHRRVGDTDVWFISNQVERFETVDCSFRVQGRRPELWRPDTGSIEAAPIFEEKDGRTRVSLLLEPYGSVFVVFPSAPPPKADHLVSFTRNGADALRPVLDRAPKLEIVKAVYGVLKPELPGMVDVTAKLAGQVRDGLLVLRADNSIAGDPAPGVVKQLRVDCVLNGKPRTVTVDENGMLRVPADGKSGGRLVIRRALYGVIPERVPKVGEVLAVDVTDVLRARVKDNRLSVVADNSLAGDPAHLIVKQLRVDYTVDGRAATKIVPEGRLLDLPTELGNAHPAAQVRSTAPGAVEVRAWIPGRYELKTAAGRFPVVNVAAVPDPVGLAGPWQVRFPKGWGAPARVRFEKLVSWTDRPESGIKYFSGTATYAKDIVVPGAFLTRDRAVVLDLGVVKNIARLRVNDRDFGVLWKPPFRIDVTRALRSGENHIEVRVTNNWPNRLIGDEQLPPDGTKWQGDRLAEWPKWVRDGKPRPRSPRYTWTTWRHYRADSPLLESGLLGPVQLRVLVLRPVKLAQGPTKP